MRALILATVLLFSFTLAHKSSDENQLIRRLIRAANSKKPAECRYDKEAWEECESSGLQRRALKLRANPRLPPNNCEPVKYITRTCKKACRYTKGEWSDCQNGEKTRTDTLKTESNGNGNQNCDATRSVTKKCKAACRYDKSEWSPCVNGTKTKTLTLANGEAKDCEQSKVITKQCGQQNKRAKHGRQRNGKKQNAPTTPS